MKKVIFCAAMLAAMSMVFVACGKKENKEAENEGAQPGIERQALNDAVHYSSDSEELVKDIEASVKEGNYEKAFQVFAFVDVNCKATDFTEAQKNRLLNAYGQVPEEIKDQYRYEE